MKDLAVNIWNKVIDGYEGNSKYRWINLKDELEELIKNHRKDDLDLLEALRQVGVDNWEGWGDALELRDSWKEKK